MEGSLTSQRSSKIPDLQVGGINDWLPLIQDYLDSKGALYTRWMDAAYRLTLLRILHKEKDPMRQLKIRDRMMEEQTAIGLVRLHVCKYLNACTSEFKTLRGLLAGLQKHATVVSVTAVGHYQTRMQAIRCKKLSDITEHIAEFDMLIKNMRDNKAEPPEPAKCAAFLASWPPVLSYKVELMEERKDLTYEDLKGKLTAYALDENLKKKEAEMKGAFIAEDEMASTSGNTDAIPKIRKRDLRHEDLTNVDEQALKVWRRHLPANHQCDMGSRCWFRASAKGRRPTIIEKFIQAEGAKRRRLGGES
jgi:hypothetical protein